MLTRANFSTPEWNSLQTALVCTVKYVALSQNNSMGNIIEYLRASGAMRTFADQYPDAFFKELSDFSAYKSPLLDYADDSAVAIEAPTIRAIEESVHILGEKDPESLMLFSELVRDLASTTAATSQDVAPSEIEAIQKIDEALTSGQDDISVGHEKYMPKPPEI